MKFTLKTAAGQNYEAYAYTGGKAFDATKPTLVFIHGVLNDHSVWILQTRYLAHHGYSVLALDYRGYGRSEGFASIDTAHADAELRQQVTEIGLRRGGLEVRDAKCHAIILT